MSVAILAQRDCDVHDLLSRAQMIDKYPDAEERLNRWIRTSEQVWLGKHDDKVACIWGLAPLSMVSNRAYLWLLTTDVVDKHKFLFVRHSQMVIQEALKQYPIIIGHVEVGNDRARKWLRWLGADIGTPDKGFSPFMIRRR